MSKFDQNYQSYVEQGVQDPEQLTVVTNVTEAIGVLEKNNYKEKIRRRWTTEEKVELVKIDIEERSKGLYFMERIKKRWDEKYPEVNIPRQSLRDNASRFKKDKAIMNLILVKENREEPHVAAQEPEEDRCRIGEERRSEEINNLDEPHVAVQEPEEDRSRIGEERRSEEINNLDDQEVREEDEALFRKFCKQMNEIPKVTDKNFQGRQKLPKVKHLCGHEETANRILTTYLRDKNNMSDIVDATYAMALAVCEGIGVKQETKKEKKQGGERGNRREKEKKEENEIIKTKYR